VATKVIVFRLLRVFILLFHDRNLRRSIALRLRAEIDKIPFFMCAATHRYSRFQTDFPVPQFPLRQQSSANLIQSAKSRQPWSNAYYSVHTIKRQEPILCHRNLDRSSETNLSAMFLIWTLYVVQSTAHCSPMDVARESSAIKS
jgi:hypothetical protein